MVVQSKSLLTALLVSLFCSGIILAQPPLIIPDTSQPAASEQAPMSDATVPADASLSISTNLLSALISQKTVENDDVATRVLQADVRGVQTTTTSVTIETQSDRQQARFDLVARGNVNSNTIGVTPQARISTQGSHTFSVRKPVYFDGRLFRTKAAFGRLQARQVPQNVQSIATGIPLIGNVGNQIAWREVLRRMPESDAVVVRRVADDVMPKFNRRTDEKLAAINVAWAEIRAQIDRVAGSRIAWTARTGKDKFRLEARGTASSALSSPFPGTLREEESCSVVLSGTAMNEVLEDLPIAGQTLTDTSLKALVDSVKSNTEGVAGLLPALRNLTADTEPVLFSIQLAQHQPLTVWFDGGALTVRLRLRIIPKAGAAGQWIQLEVPVRGATVSKGIWTLKATEITCSPVDEGEQPDQWTRMIQTQASQITKLAQPPSIPRTVNLNALFSRTGDEANLPDIELHRILMSRNWLRVSFRTVSSSPATKSRAAAQ